MGSLTINYFTSSIEKQQQQSKQYARLVLVDIKAHHAKSPRQSWFLINYNYSYFEKIEKLFKYEL